MAAILLLDDDPDFERLIAPLLERLGHSVVRAGSGAAAWPLLDSQRFDLIVVDALLPDTDGERWIEELRARDPEGRPPVVFVSSYWRDRAAIQVLVEDLGVVQVLHKPVIPHLFAEQLHAILAPSSEPPVAPPRRSEAPPPDLEDTLRSLRAQYAAALPARLVEMASLLERLRVTSDHGANPAELGELRGVAHRLRGTSGSYGFREISEPIGTVEDILLRAEADRREPTGVEWSAMARAVERASAHASRARPRSLPPRRASSTTALQPVRVLMVDDDPGELGQVTLVARRHLVELIPALGPTDAMARARESEPDAAVIDVRLGPGANAFGLARALRDLPGCSDLPIAFVSSEGSIETRIAAAHAGGSVFLEKPITPEVFSEAISRLVGMRHTSEPTILVLDRDTDFAHQLEILGRRERWRIEVVGASDEILNALERSRPEVLIMTPLMPRLSGFDIARMVRAMPEHADLQILFVTDRATPEARAAAFEAGADDYLIKPIVGAELLARIRVRIERVRLLRDRADRDTLTGLLLRRPFSEAFARRLAEARRHGEPIALALIDLDRFKEVNDLYGHLAGDRVLVAFGRLLSGHFRAEDIRGRWGGEEFVLGFPKESAESIGRAMDRLREELGGIDFSGDRGESFHVVFSAGVAAWPRDGETLDDLLATADRRLYAAKRAGRGRVVAAD